MTKLADILKNIVQQPEWPMGIVVSGLPVVSELLGRDRQIERRSHTVRFEGLRLPEHGKLLRTILKDIPGRVGMQVEGEVLNDKFVERLCHAAEGALGSAISLVRSAVLEADQRGGSATSVAICDFAMA